MAKKFSVTPPMEFRLGYETAASLHHLMTAQHFHAKRVFEETGQSGLLEAFKTTERFYLALTEYVEKYQ